MLDKRELATVLAALRYWQQQVVPIARIGDDIATDVRHVIPLSDAEIDRLCERLNLAR